MSGINSNLPDWLQKSSLSVESQHLISETLQSEYVSKPLLIMNLLLYAAVGVVLTDVVFDRTMIGALIMVATVFGVVVSGTFVSYVLLKNLTLKQIIPVYTYQPLFGKIFVFGSIFLSAFFLYTNALIIPSEQVSFIDFAYDNIFGVIVFYIGLYHPFNGIRKDIKKNRIQSKLDSYTVESNDSSESENKEIDMVHSAGKLDMVDIENSDGKSDISDLSPEELDNAMNEYHEVMTQIANSKKKPLALAPEDVETLQKYNCLDEYLKIYNN